MGDTGRAKVDYDDLFARASRTGTNEEFEQVAEVGRFRITLERAGLGQPGGTPSGAESSVGKGLRAATYSNGRGERSQADPGDLNGPLSHTAAG